MNACIFSAIKKRLFFPTNLLYATLNSISVNSGLTIQVAPKIKERMMREGSMMVTYQPLRQLPNFFRLVVQSSGTTRQDMDFFIAEIQRLGADL